MARRGVYGEVRDLWRGEGFMAKLGVYGEVGVAHKRVGVGILKQKLEIRICHYRMRGGNI